MELETVVLESNKEMDFGDAQLAYNSYPNAEKAFYEKRDEYIALIEELKPKDPNDIATKEIERTDILYENAKKLQQECMNTKVILSCKFEELILRSKELEGDITYHAINFNEEEGMERARTLIKEAIVLKDHGDVIEAVETAYQARECMEAILGNAKNEWVESHIEKVDNLSLDTKS